MTITLDDESRSWSDLTKTGAWAYSEHESTELICSCWAVDDGPVASWFNPDLGDILPDSSFDSLLQAIENGHNIEAHNAAFEYSMWHNIKVPRYGFPVVPPERWRDTMAAACYYAMPAALGPLCKALGLKGKNPEGDRLITKYSKLYLKTVKTVIPPEDQFRWLQYCGEDVEQEREVGHLLGDLPDEELDIFLRDFRINIRGLALDAHGIALAQIIVEERAAELAEEFREITGVNPGQRDKIMDWVEDQGLQLPNLRADTIEELLDEGRIGDEEIDEIDEELRRALEVRRAHGRASTKKLDAMQRQSGKDGRARFQTRYHGAVTGRQTGGGIQPLNLNKGWGDVEPEMLVQDIEFGNARWLDFKYGDAMEAVAKATRHWIVPEEGSRIVAGDFSSIEAVVNAALAGEEWKVQLFRDGGDPYCAFASKALGRMVRKKGDPLITQQDKDDRQKIGKPGELAFGYQGAVGAWRKFDRSRRYSDADIAVFVRSWRDLHPNIVEQWYGLEDAALEAVAFPGRVTGWRDQEMFERVDGWLTMILPDGKRIWYWAPQIRMGWPQWHQPDEDEDCAAGTCDCKKRPQLTYMTAKGKSWFRTSTYGGKVCENRVQAASRQILKPAEARLERAGYRQILGVYDETVFEMPFGRGSAEEVKELLEIPAGPWCEGWPVRAEVWEGGRYKK